MKAAIATSLATILCAVLCAAVTVEWAGTYRGAAAFAVFATMLLLALAVASRKRAPRSAAIASAIGLAWAAPAFVVARAHFARPYGELAPTLSAVSVMLAFGLAAPLIAIVAGGAALTRTFDGMRRVLAWGFAIAACIAFAASASRASRDDLDDVASTMPVVVELDPVMKPTLIGDVSFELVAASRSGMCSVVVAGYHGTESYEVGGGRGSRCPRVRLRAAPHDAVVVIETFPSWQPKWQTLATVSTATGGDVRLEAATLRNSVRVPLSWTSGVAFGAALALGALLVARRMRIRARALEALLDAEHEGDGWFSFDDGTRARVPLATELAKGPFSVRISYADEGRYRRFGRGDIEPICAGSVEDNVARVRDFAASCEGIALAAAAVSMAPAVAALAVVFG